MGRKPTVQRLKKARIDLIMKSRKITITKMAADMGYNRKSLSRAINREEMAEKTLDDIARYLDVSPDFLTGKDPLRRVKAGRLDDFRDNFGSDMLDPSGYLVPPYSYFMLSKSIEEHKSKPITALVPEYGYIQQAYNEIGKSGVFDGEIVRKFDDGFIQENFNYLIVETNEFMKEQAASALNKDSRFTKYSDMETIAAESAEEEITLYESLIEEVPEGEE